MKIYIFGSNKEKFTCKAKNAAYVGDNMDEALEKFQEIIDCIKFYNCYLVVDFEAGNGRKLFRSVSLDDDTEETISFFVVAQWDLSKDRKPSAYILRDTTEIVTNGFIHEFSNNLRAYEFFMYCVRNKEEAIFNIRYKRDVEIKTDDKNISPLKVRNVTRRIGYSGQVRKIQDRKLRAKPVTRFRFSNLSWNPAPLTKRTFYNVQMKPVATAVPAKETKEG